MKRNILFSVLFSVCVATTTVAQTTPTEPQKGQRREKMADTTPQQRADRQTAQMKKRLALTAGQEAKVAAINLNYARQMQPIIEKGDRNRSTAKQVRDLMARKDDELKNVLDKKQYEQYESLREERKDRLKEKRQ